MGEEEERTEIAQREEEGREGRQRRDFGGWTGLREGKGSEGGLGERGGLGGAREKGVRARAGEREA